MLVVIVTLIVSTIVVFNHQLIWLLAIFPGLYIVYAGLLAFSKAPDLNNDIWQELSPLERAVWNKYHVFFRFSMAAPVISRNLTTIQIIFVITGVALVITEFYWGGLLVLGWFIGLLAPTLNPVIYLVDAAKKGNTEAAATYEAMSTLHSKLQRIK